MKGRVEKGTFLWAGQRPANQTDKMAAVRQVIENVGFLWNAFVPNAWSVGAPPARFDGAYAFFPMKNTIPAITAVPVT